MHKYGHEGLRELRAMAGIRYQVSYYPWNKFASAGRGRDKAFETQEVKRHNSHYGD